MGERSPPLHGVEGLEESVALLILGLVLTFYFPRRRAWARITGQHVELAFVADRYVDADREFERLREAIDTKRPGTASGA